ncbi:MAG: AAA family ATPase [Chlamydiales bacterium]|nr:AAA family ATPase [Chlamydiia bacterium]MCP5506771.1 AAA family ATPase [Chlamydiales bacterium]
MTSTTFGDALEDSYLIETDFPIFKENLVVISGCSGGGKSTLLSELAARGYSVVLEPGRQIVKEQTAIEGDALPWCNLRKFLDLAMSRYLFQFNSQKEHQQLIFFDRGIIDALQLDQSQPIYFQHAAKKFRYNRLVFLVPPWKEIFENDAERKHDFESAKKEFDELLIKYKNFGYETVLVPKVPVKERANFILERLGASSRRAPSSNFFVGRAKRLLEWNREKLTIRADLKIEDLEELFAPEFVVRANEREYDANHQNYFEFLNKFRSDIEMIDYQVQEYLNTESTVVMPLTATVKRTHGKEDIFNAIMLVRFNESGKIVHWQEVYSVRQLEEN